VDTVEQRDLSAWLAGKSVSEHGQHRGEASPASEHDDGLVCVVFPPEVTERSPDRYFLTWFRPPEDPLVAGDASGLSTDLQFEPEIIGGGVRHRIPATVLCTRHGQLDVLTCAEGERLREREDKPSGVAGDVLHALHHGEQVA
jgi:hypothetical protein